MICETCLLKQKIKGGSIVSFTKIIREVMSDLVRWMYLYAGALGLGAMSFLIWVQTFDVNGIGHVSVNWDELNTF